jgi:hypothetical protein
MTTASLDFDYNKVFSSREETTSLTSASSSEADCSKEGHRASGYSRCLQFGRKETNLK